MRSSTLALAVVVVCAGLGSVSAQDAYTQGVVQGATLALAGTAVVGLGAIAIKQHQNRQRNRYRGYNPYYNGGYYQGYYQNQNYYRPQYYRRRRAADSDELEVEFKQIITQDEGQCAMKVVCQLEAKAADGETLSEFGQLIISLFGTEPVPVPTSALDSARGRFAYAAYVGSTSDQEVCAKLYSTCKYNSKEILANIKASQKAVPEEVKDTIVKADTAAADKL